MQNLISLNLSAQDLTDLDAAIDQMRLEKSVSLNLAKRRAEREQRTQQQLARAVQVNAGMRLESVPFRMIGPHGFLTP